MKTPTTTTIIAFVLVLSMGPYAAAQVSDDKLHEERAYTLGTAAFIWGFPMNELYRVRAKSLSQGSCPLCDAVSVGRHRRSTRPGQLIAGSATMSAAECVGKRS